MSCTIKIAGRELTTDEVIESYFGSPLRFDDVVLLPEESKDFIAGVPVRHQLETAEALVSFLLRDINIFDYNKDKGKQKLTKGKIVSEFDKHKKKILEAFNEAIKVGKLSRVPEKVKSIGRYSQTMKDEFEKIENLAMRVLINKGLFSLSGTNIDTLLDTLSENEFRNFNEDFQFTRDLKDNISDRLRFFLAQVNSGRTTMNNIPLFMDMDEVYIAVRTILSGVKPDYYLMMNTLLKEVKHKPWLQEVIDRLDKDESIRNEFISNMTSHPVGMLFINPVEEDGKIEWKITQSNRNTGMMIVFENWQDSVVHNKNLYYEDPKDGSYRIIGSNTRVEGEIFTGSHVIEALTKKYENIAATEHNMQKFLEDIGITISMDAIEYIRDNGFTVVNTPYTLESFMKVGDASHGISKILEDLRALSIDGTAFEDKSIFSTDLSGSLLKELAAIEFKVSKNIPLSSFRSGDHSITSHILNRYATNRVRDLVQDSDLRDKLSKLPFNSNRLLELLDDPVLQKDFLLEYPDISQVLGEKDTELRELTPEEHLNFALVLHQNNGYILKKKYRSVKMLYPTMSDKKNKYILSSPMDIINNYRFFEDGQLHPAVAEYLVNYLIMPEYNRIIAEQNEEFRNISGYNEGRKEFFIFPELNNMDDLFFTDESGTRLKPTNLLTEEDKEAMRKVVTAHVMDEFNSINNKFGHVFSNNMTKGYKKMLESFGVKDGVKITDASDRMHNQTDTSIMDFIVSSLISNMNVMQLISGDPAMFWKKNNGTWDNYAKRWAKDNAPGMEIADTADPVTGKRNKYRVLFAQDIKSHSEYLNHFKNIKAEEGYGDEAMETTDAQAWISLKEWAHILFYKGDITEDEYKAMNAAYLSDSKLDPDLLKRAVNVFKPVVVTDHIDNGVERKVYIKMSTFPLIPELTKGTELDEVRIMMKKKDVDMVAFKTAAKVGSVHDSNLAKLFTTEEISENSILELDRDGFRIQQEIPQKEDNLVNRGTQFTKLLFSGIRHLEGVAELETRYDELYNELYAKKRKDLEAEIIKDGVLNFEKLNSIIKQELIERKYDMNTLEYFDLIVDEQGRKNFKFPFWQNPQNKRIEPIINALIDSRIRKTKFPGKSYVLASRAGFKTRALTLEDYQKTGGGLVFTSTYEFGSDLKPQVFDKNTQQRAQVIVPWNFRDENGQLLSMKDYMTDGKIDFAKIPQELLQIQGFRIPTQGLNSMSAIEIVGFLPEGVTDLIIAPAEYVTQMGSDFDVDKLYTYQHAYTVKEGQIAVLTREDNLEKGIINEILDIHNAILTNPDPEVQRAIVKKLDYGMFDNKNFYDILGDQKNKNKVFIMPSQQMVNYIGASSAKTAVGTYSLASTFNALIQDPTGNKELELNWEQDFLKLYDTPGEFNRALRTFGKVKASNNLSTIEIANFNEKTPRYKSDVISAIQSAAVDNENKRILERIGVTGDTLSIPIALAQLGFTEDYIATMLKMPLVESYSDIIYSKPLLKKVLNGHINDLAREKMNANLSGRKDYYGAIKPSEMLAIERKAVLNNLKEAIEAPIEDYQKALRGEQVINQEYLGIAALYQVHSFSSLGEYISEYNRLLNIDSAGLKKNFLEVIVYDVKFQNMLRRRDPILNFIGEFVSSEKEGGLYKIDDVTWFKPTKISSIMYFNEAKFVVDNIYSDDRFSIYKTPVFEAVRDEILKQVFNKSLNDITITELMNFYKLHLDNIKSSLIKYMYSGVESLYPDGLINFKSKMKQIENEVRLIRKGKSKNSNKFLNVLDSDRKGNILYRASKKVDDFSNEITDAMKDLFFIDRTIPEIGRSSREFILDLIRYNYIVDPFQKATNFSRYIDIKILDNLGISEAGRNFDLNDLETIGYSNQQISSFTRQFFQNFPNVLQDIGSRVEYKKGKVIDEEGNQLNPKLKKIIKIDGVLYEADGQNYTRLANLYNEYDIYQSVIKNSKVIVQKESDFKNKYFEPIPPKIKTGYIDQLSAALRDNNLQKTLELISTKSTSSSFRKLASNFLDNPFLKDALIVFNNVPLGRTSYLDYFNMIQINESNFSGRDIHNKETIILHELVHVFTKRAIHLYRNKETRDQLNPEQLSAMNKLTTLFNFFQKSIDPKVRESFQNRLSEARKNNTIPQVTSEEADIIYASTNLEEFMAILPTNRKLQDYLKGIVVGKTSLWEKIKDILLEVLTAFGMVKADPDMLVKEAISEILTVINTNDTILVPSLTKSSIFASIKDISPNNPLLDVC